MNRRASQLFRYRFNGVVFRLIAGSCLLVALAGCSQVPIVGQADFGEDKLPVYDERRVSQEFFSTDQNLTRLDIFFYPSAALAGKKSLAERRVVLRRLTGKNVVIRVYSLPQRRVLAELKQPMRKMRQATMYKFNFAPVQASKEKPYLIEISAPDSSRGLAVSVGLTSIDRYAHGQARLNGRALGGSDIRFQPYIEMSAAMLFNSVGGRLLKDTPFLALWVALVIATAVLALFAWRPPPRPRKGEA